MEIAGVSYLKFVLALAFVLGLIALCTSAAKRLGLGYQSSTRRGTGKRLTIIETLPIDAKRRVILIGRDDKEHLVILGADGAEVIESGIEPPDITEQPEAKISTFPFPVRLKGTSS